MNKVILVGRLGQDVELRYTPGGNAVANLSVATTEVWNDKEKGRQEKTEWHRVVVFGKQAENCNIYLKKGREVSIEGKIQTREWETKTGEKRHSTEIVAENVQFIGGRGE